MHAGSSDALQIATRFKAGDPEAVRVVQRRVRKVLSFKGYGIPADHRSDLEQEVMAQLWQAAGGASFRPDAGFWGFVDVVVGRRCIDWLRTRKQTVELPELESGASSSPLGRLLAEERRELAYAALARLGKPCRDAVYLHAVLGLGYREMAGLLAKSEGALRVLVHRCVKRARQALLELADGDSAQGRKRGES